MGIKVAELVQMQRRLNRANGHEVRPMGKTLVEVFAEEEARKTRKLPRVKDPVYAALFRQVCINEDIPVPTFEFHFHPDRLWRFDIAWPSALVAVEVQGGLWKGRACPACGQRTGGRHNRPGALQEEMRKLTEAAQRGWRVLFFVPEVLTLRTTMQAIKDALMWDRVLHPRAIPSL